jgi:type I restriction enzyme, S subunit
LLEIADFVAGQSPDSQFYNDQGVGLPFLQGNADFGGRYPVPRVWTTQAPKKCHAGDTLVSVRAPVGEVNRADREYALGRGLGAVSPTHIDGDFLYHAMSRWRVCLMRVGQGTTFDAVTARHFGQLKAALPETEAEQRAIADILNAVDMAIERTGTAIEKARRLKRGLMQQLLPPWFGVKHVAPGILGDGIEVLPASQVARVANGSTPSRVEPAYWRAGTIPWLATGKVNDEIITEADEYATEKALAECSIELLPPGTVLIGMIGQGKTRGMAAFLSFAACINQNFGAFVPGPRLDGKFLYHYFSQYYSPLREIGGGTNQGALNCYILKRIRIPVPPIEQQKQIAEKLDACAALATQYGRVLDKLERLKRGLMQDLLTGRVRVPVGAMVDQKTMATLQPA